MPALYSRAQPPCTKRYSARIFPSCSHKIIFLKEIFFLTHWFIFLKTALKTSFCPTSAKQSVYACNLLMMFYRLLKIKCSREVQKKCKAGQMSLSNIPKVTWVDNSEALDPTQAFSDLCCQGSRVTKWKENWARKQQTIAAAKNTPILFSAIFVFEWWVGGEESSQPSTSLNNILHFLPVNLTCSQRHNNILIKVFWWLQTLIKWNATNSICLYFSKILTL